MYEPFLQDLEQLTPYQSKDCAELKEKRAVSYNKGNSLESLKYPLFVEFD